MQVGGSIIDTAGQVRGFKAEEQAARYNRDLALAEGAREEERIRSAAADRRSRNIVNVAKSGVRMEGSPLAVLAENAERAEREALEVRRSAQVVASLEDARRRNARLAGKTAITSGIFGAGSALASGFAGG